MDLAANGRIRSVDKAVDILRVLSSEGHGLALTEIARRLGFKDSTTHHLVATLMARGFIDQDPKTKAYRLGFGMIALVNGFLAGTDLHANGLGPIQALRDASGETSYLTVLHGRELVTVIEMLGSRPIQCRRPTMPGQSCLHSTASGKALLAHLSPARTDEMLATLPLTKFTSATIDTMEALRAELAAIRRQGYALDRQENLEGVACVAAPVFGRDGACVATASVAFPALPNARWDEAVRLVADAASSVSANLGHVATQQAVGERRAVA